MTLRTRPETDRLHVVQEWEGYVLEIVGDEFVARLTDRDFRQGRKWARETMQAFKQ